MNNEIIVILGRKGSGKTYLARRLMADKRRLIVYDPIRQLGDLGVVVHDPVALIAYIRQNCHRNFRVVYQPQVNIRDNGVMFAEFQNVLEMAYYTKNVYLFLDEIFLYIPRTINPTIIDNLITAGRHSQISFITTTIRYTDTSRKLTSQADVMICFQTQEPADIKYLKDIYGDAAEKLKTLPPYHYLKIDRGTVTEERPV